MLSADQITALKTFYKIACQAPSATWALTGSTSMALQGMTLDVHDIDVQTDKSGAYQLGKLLDSYALEPVHFCGTDLMRSHFGRFKIGAVDLEIMGDIEKKRPDGSWEEAVPLPSIIEHVQFEGMNIPVLSLAYEAQAYKKIGRAVRSAEIEDFINRSKSV